MWRKLTNINRILVPVDLTDDSLCAAEAALTLAKDRKSQIYLIHVIQKTPTALPVPHNSKYAAGVSADQTLYQDLENFFTKKIKARSSFAYIVRSGSPSEEILTFAREEAVDLIILPIGRKEDPSVFAPGEIASQIIEHSVVPVLIVKPDSLTRKSATSKQISETGELDAMSYDTREDR